jgi:hypothetical protein
MPYRFTVKIQQSDRPSPFQHWSMLGAEEAGMAQLLTGAVGTAARPAQLRIWAHRSRVYRSVMPSVE